MSSRSLRDAMNEAKKASGGGTNVIWDTEDRVLVEIVGSNVKMDEGYTPQVGIQLERKDTSNRKWFTLWFNQGDTPEDKKRLASTGRTLSTMGCDELMDVLADAYGDDLRATLEALSSALKGVKYYAKITKSETPKTRDNAELGDDERDYRNYQDPSESVEGPYVPNLATPAGFGQAAAAAPEASTAESVPAPAAPSAPSAAPSFGADFKPLGS